MARKFPPTDSQRRSKIKREWVFEGGVCSKCKRKISKEWVYTVTRWNPAMKKKFYTYCKDCAPSVTHVLNVIDTDEILFGIANTDHFLDYEKLSLDSNFSYIENLIRGHFVL